MRQRESIPRFCGPTALALAILAYFLCGLAPRAPGAIVESDHTFWLTVQTTPPGASVFAVSETGETSAQPLGHTPCTLAVDLNWGSRWFKKRWEMITVLSPDGFCRPQRQPDGSYQLAARLVVSKENWKPVRVETPMAVLADPGKDRQGKKQWPTKHTIALALEPAGGEAGPAIPRAAGLRRVVMAGDHQGAGKVETGSVTVFSRPPGAEVFVDDRSVGVAPVELLLRAGRHQIEVRAGRHPPSRREIELAPEAALSFEAAFPR